MAGGFETFFLFSRFTTPDREFYSNLRAKSLLCFPSHSEHPCPPSSFSLALHRVGRPAASSAGIKSRAVIMNDSRGERGYIIVIDGREGRSRGWLPFNLEANPFAHPLPLLLGRHRTCATRRRDFITSNCIFMGKNWDLVDLVPFKVETGIKGFYEHS